LPDIVVSDPGGLLGAVRGTASADWVVVAAGEPDPGTLQQMGALTVRQEGGAAKVVAAAEKPADPTGFNALWGIVAVTEAEAHRLPDVVRRDAASPLAGAAALMVERIVNYNTVAG
jgi:hypothetical protein